MSNFATSTCFVLSVCVSWWLGTIAFGFQFTAPKNEDSKLGNHYIANDLTVHLTKPRRPDNGEVSFCLPTHEFQKGNAATYYYRAGLIWNQRPHDNRLKLWQNPGWFESGFESFPVHEVQKYLGWTQDSQYPEWAIELERAAFRKKCDWQLESDEYTYEQWIKLFLPELDLLRQFSKVNFLMFRLALKRKDYLEAEKRIQIGFQLLNATRKLPGFASGSNAIAQFPFRMIMDWSEQLDAPAFDQAIREIRLPRNDYLERLRKESELKRRTYEILQNPYAKRSAKQWQSLFEDAMRINDVISSAVRGNSDLDGKAKTRSMRARLLLAQLYPIAKEELRRRGVSPAELETMVPEQVVAIQSKHIFDQIVRPYRQVGNLDNTSRKDLESFVRNSFREQGFEEPGRRGDFPIELMERVVSTQTLFGVRTQRDLLTVLIIIQDMRNYLADKGRLPDSLDELGQVYAVHSESNLPFRFVREDGKFYLQSPTNTQKFQGLVYAQTQIRVEIRIRDGEAK